MLRFSRSSLAFASVPTLFASWLTAGVAAAQTTTTTPTTTTGPTVTISTAQVSPNRIVNGKNLGLITRPINLTPTGISYTDCTSDMVLSYPLVVTGFDGGEVLQVWAGAANTDCSLQANRGYGVLPICWQVAQPIAGIVAAVGSPVSKNISVRVQDIVSQASFTTKTATYTPAGAAACNTQSVDTAQSITVYFVPTYPNNTDFPGSVAWPNNILVDLLGPAAPIVGSVKAGAGDTLLVPSWTANIDPDTIGYDIYIDPIPGQESSSVVGAEPFLVCSEAGAAKASSSTDASVASNASDADDGAGGDADLSDVSDANTATTAPTTVADAECVLQYPANSVGAGTGGICSSSVLTNSGSLVVEAGTVAATAGDDASEASVGGDANLTDLGDADTVVAGGGISNVNSRYLYKPDTATGITVPAMSATTYNITGLENGLQYNIAIAAVDALGNVGPLSTLQCGSPAPVDDFWKKYREGGGQAGGGICALESPGAPAGSAVFLGGFVSLAVAAMRRRRK